MSEHKPTRKQHFIPQFYLNNFGYVKSVKTDAVYFINHIDLKTMKLTERPVSTQYYKIDLYECDGIATNEVEKILSNIEGEMASIIKRIIEKSDKYDDFLKDADVKTAIPNIITNDDIIFIIKYLYLQIFRTPDMLSLIPKPTEEMLNSWKGQGFVKYMSEQLETTDIGKIYFLGIATDFENGLFANFAKEIAMTHNMQILKTYNHNFFTSNNPVILHPTSTHIFKDATFCFPITPNLCIVIRERDDIKGNNVLIKTNTKMYEHIVYSILMYSNEIIFKEKTKSISNILEKYENLQT